jgi:hypothetical protein
MVTQAATSVVAHVLYLSDTGRVHTSDTHFETAYKKKTRLLQIKF